MTVLAMCAFGSSDSAAVCVRPSGVRRLLYPYRVSARGGDRRGASLRRLLLEAMTLLAMCALEALTVLAVCVRPCGVRRLLCAYRVSP